MVAAPASGEVRVRALFGAVSRGTERLVHAGRVPPSEYQRMRAPLMGGAFPFPVKYGYATVGRVEAGPEKLRDRITALGGEPTMETAKEELIAAVNLKQILAINLKEEAKAIDHYKSILKMLDRQEEVLLYEVIEDIIEDEQEHREELSRLQER